MTAMVNSRQEYMSEAEAAALKVMYKRFLEDYKKKGSSITDEEWLVGIFKREVDGISDEQAEKDAREMIESIREYDKNLESVRKAAKTGKSKESWLASKIEESSAGLAVQEYGRILQTADSMLYQKNLEMANALTRAADGNVIMNPNLDGNIAEHMVAGSAELSAFMQGKNIEVRVNNSNAANSVDVTAVNHSLPIGTPNRTQHYQLKFGKDAKATIKYIEEGNYDNQRIIVPKEQLEEVRAYFRNKGSKKTITDHVDAWGVEGKSFTKEEMKEIQLYAQKDGNPPQMDYTSFQTKDLAMSIGRNAGAMALQAAAVTTGLNIAYQAFSGEEMKPDEMVESALRTGADTGIKIVTAGTLQVATRKGLIKLIPPMTKANVIANIACVGVENVKILMKVASGELSLTKGIDQMGCTTVSMIGGLWAMGAVGAMVKGSVIGASLTSLIPVVGIPLAVVTGFAGGMVGYFAGSKVGETVYNAGKKVAKAVRNVAKSAVEGIKKVGSSIVSTVGSLLGRVFG